MSEIDRNALMVKGESQTLVNRLRGKYGIGPDLPNGEPEFGYPEFGYRQFPTVPIQIEAADRIEELERELRKVKGEP
jgi:hypothetical protein